MRASAIKGEWGLCRYLAKILVADRKERPNIQLYNMLVLSNVGHQEGAAWRVAELLDDMEKDGIQPDVGTCHAVLKVLSVHVDHLLRADILDYMSHRWMQLSEDGWHDVTAGLLREGLFEQAANRLDAMRRDGMHIHVWLLDMAVFMHCTEFEIGEAYRVMRQRVDDNEPNISRSLWLYFLDKASEARHHPAVSLAWTDQVQHQYINPSSGICLNILATAAKAADANLATEVFAMLSQRGVAFQPIHYEILINTYLATDPPDFQRALTVLTIMALEKVEPSVTETRSLYLYMKDKPDLIPQAIQILRDLHSQDRKIPISALNLLIECYVDQGNLKDAMTLYKQIHTFAPINDGARKTFANIETFNLLLKGCRQADPPDGEQASFLVSELLALRIKPTALTYDRLILLFMTAGLRFMAQSQSAEDVDQSLKLKKRGLELIDWAYRHFSEMQPLNWLPRFGTLEHLSVALAKVGDLRCWDVLQAAEDGGKDVDGWATKGSHARRNVVKAWEEFEKHSRPPEESSYAVGVGINQ